MEAKGGLIVTKFIYGILLLSWVLIKMYISIKLYQYWKQSSFIFSRLQNSI